MERQVNKVAKTINPGKLTDFSARVLEKLGVPAEDARITADMLVTADLRGVDSHGVAHLALFYAKRIKEGVINVKPNIKTVRSTPSTAVVDGDRGLGFVVGYRSMEKAMAIAAQTGAGFVTVRNSTHYGAGAYYSMMALPRDMIGFSFTQGGPGVNAPGTRGKTVGLNVISVAVPSGKETPFVLDMATGVVANGKLELAARNGVSIPSGWALDKDGNTTTEVAKATGGILPLGGTPFTGVYKGFGLTFIVDVLCSVLSGDITVPEVVLAGGYKGLANHFFGALNVAAFMPVADFRARMDTVIQVHHNLPKRPGISRITLAGEPEADTEKERRKNGIPLHPAVVKSLQDIATELGVEYNL
jgi:L-2-hydroxycarboxylate dehydrogenase (NAD+)